VTVLSRRRLLQASLDAAGAGAGLYTWRVEPHWLELVRRELDIHALPAELDGKLLVQLSDLHVGQRVDDDYVRGALRRVAALAPAVVVYTGDFVSYWPGVFDQLERVYADMPRGTLATLGVLGNHDYGPGWSHPEIAEQLCRALQRFGIDMLRNETRLIGGLTVAGLDDFLGPSFDPAPTLGSLRPTEPTLVLSHNPDSADEPVWGSYRGWILSGHTHGGQCKPPLLRPPLLPIRNPRYAAGEIALSDGRRLYVNRGVGHLLQVRFNVRPEITAFTLRRAA
jgi:uncharacterized protein